ncbi:PRC-barrel domain containing protein [Mesorhizobium sp. M7D.F.Ca.US.005.01.1.1]|uniref:PRC-barrel domain-containing protein n=1 Tax=Mesorhizobium sp. M7D.F.Ca.US.005.01.1.1 TaxID=2493678 RepID=UPI000F7501D9|nr:PRC-barrel domain containing protein [Mesorhizobium sp. M7D.F.Ca.US.005.01.1.1]
MFYKLLATTALATFIASGAYAGNVISAATAAQNVAVQAIPDGKLVSKFMGVEVYNGTGDNAEDIGEVNDILLSKDGTAKFLIIGVGGFLKVGEKNVAYDFDKAQWAEKNAKRWLVISATKEELTALPAFDTKAYDASLSTASTKPATPTVTPAPANSATTVDRTTLTEMPIDKIRAEDLIGTTVYGADDANVGKIGDVVLTGDKKIDAVIIDVGGFLGIGAKEVAVGFEKLKFMTDKDGNKYLYTNFTKDQLTAQTAYDKGTYVQSRDKQRLIVK